MQQISTVFNPQITLLAAVTLNKPYIHWKSYFVSKLKDICKIRHKNVEYFNLGHAHKPIFFSGHFPIEAFLLVFSSPFFSVLLLLPGCLKDNEKLK